MYIMFILNFHKVQANYQILLKWAQTSVILIVGVLYHHLDCYSFSGVLVTI